MTVRRAAAWSLTAQYATFAIQFATTIIISRFFLLPADIGLFSIALAAAMIVAIFQDMGFTRFISGQPEMREDAVPHYSALAIGIGWLVAAGVAIAAPFIAAFYGEPELTFLLWLIAGSYIIVPFALVPAALLVRAMDFRALFHVNAGSALAGNATAIALAANGQGPASLAWGVLVTAVTRAAIANWHRPVRPRLPHEHASLRPLISFSSLSFFISASAAVGQRSQDLIVGRLLGVVSTGLFSRASGLAVQLSTLVSGALTSVFYSAFARKRDAGEELAEPYLHLVACNTVLNWAAMIGLALAAEPLVLFLFGDNWAGVAPLLTWMALAELFFVAVPLHMDMPLLLGRIKTLIWVNLLDTFAAVSVLTIGCFISLEAAAMSRIAYGLLWWAIYSTYQSRLLGFSPLALLRIYAHSGLCAASAGLPLFIASQMEWGGAALGFVGMVLLAGLGALIWLAMLAMTRHPAWEEVRLAIATYAKPLAARLAG